MLICVIVAVLLVPIVSGWRVHGQAQRSSTSGPPRVGDCLSSVPSQRSSMESGQPLFAVTTRPCNESNVGEVAAVVSKIHFSPPTLDNGQTVAQQVNCDPLVRNYLGWPTPAADGGPGPSNTQASLAWQPPDTISVGLLGPGVAQYIAGQRWTACVVYPEYGPYPGSIRGSVRNGHGADTFGSCLSTSDSEAARMIPCREPHRTEIFGRMPVDADDSKANLDASCLTLARGITGMRDPTVSGNLTIAVIDQQIQDDNPEPPTRTPLGRHQAWCSATAAGSQSLAGTLIGIGDRPLPWR